MSNHYKILNHYQKLCKRNELSTSPIKICLLTPNLNQPSQYITIYQQFFLPFPKPINNVKMIDEHVN